MIPKFRAWDKEEKIMIDWIDLDMSKDGGEDDFIVFEPTGPVKSAITNPILMQSTGLKDKNGVEIYEGDIVENSHKEIGFIKNCSDAFCFNRQEWNFYLSGIGAGSPFEILGNIYENPELLEDE